MRWRGWELEEEGKRERKRERRERECESKSYIGIACEKQRRKVSKILRLLDEICIYYKVYRKLNKLATVGGNNVQLFILKWTETRTKHAQFYISNTKTKQNILSQCAYNAINSITLVDT